MTYTVEIRETIPLPVEEAFARLADHNRLGSVLGLPVRRTKDGEGDPNGLGSVRTLGVWPVDFDETVTKYEPASRIEYKISRGTPLKDHHGIVRFAPKGDGTEVAWTIRFELGVPVLGTVLKKGLGLGISRGLRKMR